MDNHKTLSESEEMYLVSIAMLVETGVEIPIPISRLAHDLNIQPVSANQMIRKLEEAGFLDYVPYKGVVLTYAGEKLASQVLRQRRLWEVFLVEHLDVPVLEAEKLACRLEHTVPDEAIERLAFFLDYPTLSPQGRSIPKSVFATPLSSDILLNQMQPGEQSQITRVEVDQAARLFLGAEGLIPGALITMLGVGHNGAALVQVAGSSIYLEAVITTAIWVEKPAISMAREKSKQT